MGMTDNQLMMIRALAENRIQDAKKCAKVCCAEDSTKKNAPEINRCKRLLENNGSVNAIELPYELSGILRMEDVSGFREGRYYMGQQEKETFGKITRARNACLRLAELGIPYLNSTLLSGVPGTGKTMFGRYVAYKLGLPFAYIDFSSLIDSYLGKTGRNVQKIFDFCAGQKCVLMLDEIDCIGLKRSNSSGGAEGELNRTTVTLLQQLDRLTNDQVVIAATNRADLLDPALLRRFYVKAEFKSYDKAGRIAMAEQFLEDVGITYNKAEIAEYAGTTRTQAEMIKYATEIVIRSVLEEEGTEVAV